MSSILLQKLKYHHLKMIHTNPRGIQNRFKDTGDKWVESLRHPEVKTYYDYFKNKQTLQYDIPDVKTQKQEMQVSKIFHSYKPGIAALNDFFKLSRPVRADDNQLARDVNLLTFAKFIQEGKKQLTPIHKLTYYGIIFVIWQIILYFTFIHGKQWPKNQRVRVLNSQILESYHFESQQTAIQKIIERIEIVNDQYERKLTQAKKKK